MRRFFPVIVLFIIINVLFLVFKNPLESADYSVNFILIANVLLFFLTWLVFFILGRDATASNVHRFMRGIYSSFLLKMFVIVGALSIFIVSTGSEVNKPAILISMGLYILYTTDNICASTYDYLILF